MFYNFCECDTKQFLVAISHAYVQIKPMTNFIIILAVIFLITILFRDRHRRQKQAPRRRVALATLGLG